MLSRISYATISIRLLLVTVIFTLLNPSHASPILSALVASYPDHLSGTNGDTLIFKNGTRLPLSDGCPNKSFDELLAHPSIADMFAQPYPLGGAIKPPARNEDPGRFRNQAFFSAMYGDCRKGEVSKHLVRVAWLPRHGGGSLRVTGINGVAEALRAVSRELDALPEALVKYAAAPAGGYNCRPVAGTERTSMHAYGAAVDIAARFSDYWRWRGNRNNPVWRNRIPAQIVDIFERHGFIWGGRWYHYDTMHFEYRPELIAAAKAITSSSPGLTR